MISNGLFLLPLVALALIFRGTWLGGDRSAKWRSRRFQRRYHFKVWFHRSLIISLLLATLIARLRPVSDIQPLLASVHPLLATIHPIVYALGLCAIFMLPYLFCVLFISAVKPLNQSSQKVDLTAARPGNHSSTRLARSETPKSLGAAPTKSDTIDIPPPPETATTFSDSSSARYQYIDDPLSKSIEQRQNVAAHASHLRSGVATSAEATRAEVITRKVNPSAGAPDTKVERYTESVSDQLEDSSLLTTTSILDQTINVDESLTVATQIENLDNAMTHHDVGAENNDEEVSASESMNNAIAMAQDAVSANAAMTETDINSLPAKSNQELTAMVANLQSDKMKLQKLVIAQKAVLESEKLSHDKTRVMANDAVVIMRRAREGQRYAQKIARRERSERKRLALDNANLKKQLQNAMSTLPSRDFSD